MLSKENPGKVQPLLCSLSWIAVGKEGTTPTLVWAHLDLGCDAQHRTNQDILSPLHPLHAKGMSLGEGDIAVVGHCELLNKGIGFLNYYFKGPFSLFFGFF